jgi:hypothetical protein
MRLFIFHYLFVCLVLPACSQSKQGDKAYWVAQYMSVSYPLEHMQVTSPYGNRKNPFTGERSMHSGLDLRANKEPVMAMFDGTCDEIGYDNRSGKYVVFLHGDYTVSYCHLSNILVREGDNIYAGDVVAISGNTGKTTGPHLHVTCKYKGKRINPCTLLEYIKETRRKVAKALSAHEETVIPQNNQSQFLAKYANAAMAHQRKYGIPASVTLSQMAYESAWGTSKLARTGNNYFGIKCPPGWVTSGKPYSLHNDDKPNEKFCNYASVEESIEHHSLFLMGKRYSRCWIYPATDYHHWLVELKRAGYATAKNYVDVCEKIISKYQLYKYDRLAERSNGKI